MKITKILPLIGVLIFIYLIYRIGLNEIINAFSFTKPIFFFASFILIILVVLIQAYKWNNILKLQNYQIPFLTILKIQAISIFYGFITPAKAGALIRINYLKQITKDSLVKCSSSTIIERIMDTGIVLFLAFLGLIFFMGTVTNQIYTFSIIFIAFLIISGIFLKKKHTKNLLKFFHKFFLPRKYKEKAKHYFHEFYSNFPRRRDLIWPTFLTFISWILCYTISYFIALSLGIDLPYHYVLLLFPISTIAGMLPISPSGLGVREATLIGLLASYGILAEQVIALSLLSIVVSGIFPALAGFIFSLKKSL